MAPASDLSRTLGHGAAPNATVNTDQEAGWSLSPSRPGILTLAGTPEPRGAPEGRDLPSS